MERFIKKSAVLLAALLALTLAAYGASPAVDAATGTPTAETTGAVQTAEADLAPSGSTRLLSPAAEGGLYEGWYDVDANGVMGPVLLTFVDYAAAERRVVCNTDGCPHTEESCPAYLGTAEGTALSLAADGDTVYALQSAQGQNAVLMAFAADGSARRTVAELPLTDVQELSWAADDDNLYLLTDGDGDYTVGTVELTAVSKVDGTVQTLPLPGWEDPSPFESFRLIGAEDHSLTIAHLCMDDAQEVAAGVDVCRYDLNARTLTTERTLTAGGDAQQNDRIYLAVNDYTGQCAVVHTDITQGTVALVDPETGTQTPLLADLPVSQTGDSVTCEVIPLGDAAAVRVFDDRENGDRVESLYWCQNGTATQLPQQVFVDVRGVTPVLLRDVQNGYAYVLYSYEVTQRQGIGQDHKMTTFEDVRDVCGVISVADLLGGSDAFIPVT